MRGVLLQSRTKSTYRYETSGSDGEDKQLHDRYEKRKRDLIAGPHRQHEEKEDAKGDKRSERSCEW